EITQAYDKAAGTGAFTSLKRGLKSGVGESLKFLGPLAGQILAGGATEEPDPELAAAAAQGSQDVGYDIFHKGEELQANNRHALNLQTNVVDRPGVLLKPGFWAGGLGNMAGALPVFPVSGAMRGADIYNETGGNLKKAITVGGLETALNLAPFGGVGS